MQALSSLSMVLNIFEEKKLEAKYGRFLRFEVKSFYETALIYLIWT